MEFSQHEDGILKDLASIREENLNTLFQIPLATTVWY